MVPASAPTVHIAQINLMHAIEPLDSPVMAAFVDLMARFHALADKSTGFVWRLTPDQADQSVMPAFADGRMLVNFTIWRSIADLWNFTYATGHLELLRRRREWTDRITDSRLALWWVSAGETPTLDTGLARLDTLRRHGPTPDAFTFRQTFPPPSAAREEPPGETAPLATGTAKLGGERGLGPGANTPGPASAASAAR